MRLQSVSATVNAYRLLTERRPVWLAGGVEVVARPPPPGEPTVCAASELVGLRLSREGAGPLLAVCPAAITLEELQEVMQIADAWTVIESSAPEVLARVEEARLRHALSRLHDAPSPGTFDPVVRLAGLRVDPLLREVDLRLLRRATGMVTITDARGSVVSRDDDELFGTLFTGEEGVRSIAAARHAGAPAEWAHAWATPLPGQDEQLLLASAGSRETLAVAARRLRALAPSCAAWIPAPESDRSRVLVIEDDPAIREILLELLSEKMEVLGAPTAASAMEMLQTHPPDAVLADLGLPDGDGLALLAHFAADSRQRDVPILVLSGRDDRMDRMRALRLGATDFLSKPYAIEELLLRLDRALSASKRLRTLRAQAETDALTGLANRRAFEVRALGEIERAWRHDVDLSVLALDLDGLKATNDRLGHPAGDALLQQVARVLAESLRASDFAARTGGDEFLVLLPHTDEDAGRALADRLLARFAEEVTPSGQPLGCSMGLTALRPVDSLSALLYRADQALLAAKQSGGHQIVVRREPEASLSQAKETGLSARSGVESPRVVRVVVHPAEASRGVSE